MTGTPLIALPPAPASPDGATVAGDGWWPAIDRNAARAALRLGEIITDARLVAALEGAWIAVTSDLVEWQAQLIAAGASSLAAITAAHLSALTVPGRAPYWASWNDADRAWDQLGPNPLTPQVPRYSPAVAAMLAGTMTDSATNTPQPRLVAMFTRAVRCTAAAELDESHRDVGTTSRGDIRAESVMQPGSDYRRMAAEAVRDILGVTRVTSELI